ncbi:PREDICTED: uncharacterized protein LOC106305292 [Brassica oleracea var. oleracea]|uniref:uncharacterized protein LOC106305292 n=1 Tax=Brassica oleracea var. oleracea TaxID=109376 RepID=UPI0006A73828|nr:PREDICTED: uncharacterized protein LOC106305292 [Brassica oleracea var. oleracea]
MAYFFFLLDDVKTWRCSTTEVHLLRFWEAEPFKQAPALAEECKERRRADMLLLDVEACSIYAESGVSGFDVTPINPNYKLSNSPPSIRFSDLTDFDEITEPVSSIPQELFQFSDYEQLQHIFLVTLSNSSTPALQSNSVLYFKCSFLTPNIIGELTAIRSTVNDSS